MNGMRRVALFVVSAIPLVIGFAAGVIVSVVLWIVASIRTGYEYGRGR